MNYYTLSIKNNPCNNKTKIKNVKRINYSSIFNMEDEYESVDLLAVESGLLFNSYMIDIISGKKIYFDDGSENNHIKYTTCKKVSKSELKRIIELYNSLTPDDIIRYKKGMYNIERIAINEYLNHLDTPLIPPIIEESISEI